MSERTHRCNASIFSSKMSAVPARRSFAPAKENAPHHGGGFAAGVFPYGSPKILNAKAFRIFTYYLFSKQFSPVCHANRGMFLS